MRALVVGGAGWRWLTMTVLWTAALAAGCGAALVWRPGIAPAAVSQLAVAGPVRGAPAHRLCERCGRPWPVAVTSFPDSPAAAVRGRWPLAGRPEVMRRFEPPANPYGRGHRGVDLAGQPGAVVLAAAPGTVSFAGQVAGRGVVVVNHANGLRTTYEPVTATAARGAVVAAGSPIGILVAGHPGCRAPACLHWGLRRGDVYLDPLSILGLGRVRLLP
jgi:murein DD-endopeptidase MepM/ murein hydrolase activator NlpD